MTHKLLVHSSNVLSSTNTTVNVFVSEDKITFRYLEETFKDPNADLDLMSHNLVYGLNYRPEKNKSIIFNYEGKKLELLYECSISFDDVKDSWKTGQICLICVPSFSSISYRTVEIRQLSMYSSTYTSKKSFADFSNDLRAFTNFGSVLYFFPSKDTNFLTSSCRLICNTPETLITNLEFTETAAKTDKQKIQDFYNKVTTFVYIKGSSTISANGSEILNVEVLQDGTFIEDPLTLKIECVDGYAPHQRVDIVNGKGSFKVTALGLNPGEQMRVKLNDGFFTSKAEHIFEVV